MKMKPTFYTMKHHHLNPTTITNSIVLTIESESQEKESSVRSTLILSGWRLYFTFAFYTFHTPFHIKLVTGHSKFWGPTSSIHKVNQVFRQCIMRPLIALNSITFATTFSLFAIRNMSKSPAAYFKLVDIILMLLRRICLHWVLNKRCEEVQNLLKILSKSSFFQWNSYTPISKLGLVYMIMSGVICVIIPVIILVALPSYNFPPLLSFEERWKNLVTGYSWRLMQDKNEPSDFFSWNSMVHGSIEFGIEFVDFVDSVLAHLLFYVLLPCTWWIAVVNFDAFVAKVAKDNPGVLEFTLQRSIVDKYNELKELSKCLSSLWSCLNFFLVLEKFIFNTFYALGRALKGVTFVAIFDAAWFSCGFVVSLLLYAEGYRKISGFKIWLEEKMDNGSLPGNELKIASVIKDLHRDPPGIGVQGVYQPDYAFFGGMSALFATVFVIGLEKT